MRLLRLEDDGSLNLIEFLGRNIPPYAILSHTWGADGDEVTFKDLSEEGAGTSKPGYSKIRFCRNQAQKDGLQFFWIDTCSIDKSSSAELSEAINSMFKWYERSAKCYVYLPDVAVGDRADGDNHPEPWKETFKKSRWFTRGWTLQELIAPKSVEFFSREGVRLGDKQSLLEVLHEITEISIEALQGRLLSSFSVEDRMSWAQKRQTKREEDAVYSLLGIFDVQMPLLYGEGQLKALIRLQKEIREGTYGQRLSQEEERERLLKSLQYDDNHARKITIKEAHIKTCSWLLKQSEYRDWLEDNKMDEHNGFLWIKGKPGVGKSTLMKFAHDRAQGTKTRIVISFFFNARGDGLAKSVDGAYRTLLLQLLEEIPDLQDILDSLTGSDPHWSIELLETFLRKTIQSLGSRSVLCFIDALDECEERQIRDMVAFFESVSEVTVSSGIKFRFCLSSRHYPHISIRKGLHMILDVQEGHNQDISNYIDSVLKIGSSNAVAKIRKRLQEKASGVFIWIVLVVGILNKEYDDGRVYGLERRLQEIPTNLHELFHDVLTRDSNHKEELVLCIQWVLFSKRMLKPEELYFAIISGMEPDTLSERYEDDITADAIRRFILSSSKGLIEITSSDSPKVQFIHESVKEFLLNEHGLENIAPDLRSNLRGQSHECLKQCCLNYIFLFVFPLLKIPGGGFPGQKMDDFVKSYWEALPFLHYAIKAMLYHADVAAESGITQEDLLRSFPLAQWIRYENLIEGRYLRRHTEHVSLLYYMADQNLPNLIRALSSSISFCLEIENERCGSPLLAALAAGNGNVIRAMMACHSSTQPTSSRFTHLYSQYREKLPVTSPIGPTFEHSRKRTMLSYLAEVGDEAVFAFALELGNLTPNCEDQDGQTPLSWAAARGHEVIVKILLELESITPNHEDQDGRTALFWAAANGHIGVVKLLLEADEVTTDPVDGTGRTALSWAAGNGHVAVVNMLLRTETVVPDRTDKEGRSPLFWAVANQHEAVARLLFNTGKASVKLQERRQKTSSPPGKLKVHGGVTRLMLESSIIAPNELESGPEFPKAQAAFYSSRGERKGMYSIS
jgi:hypothetical protein